jgi:uncharacterized protein YceK
MKRIALSLVLAAGGVGLSGCTSYYRVTDPSTGRTYYTTEMKKKGDGAVQLRDGRTGQEVTIQNSEIAKVTKEEYESGRVSHGAPH